MANNLYEKVFNNSGGASEQVKIIDDCNTGRVQLSLYGPVGSATIHIQKQLILRDGTTSAITDVETYNDEIDLEMAVGKGNNLYIEVTGMDAVTNLVCKVSELN